MKLGLERFSFRFLWSMLALLILLGALQATVFSFTPNPSGFDFASALPVFIAAILYAFLIYRKAKLRR